MPSLGADMEAGTLVEWRVKPGQAVKRGDVVAVVETDKGAIEVEIWENGYVQSLVVAAGSKVPVGTTLATLSVGGVPPGPAAPPAPAVRPATTEAGPTAIAAIPAPAPTAPVSGGEVEPAAGPRASPAARKRAHELEVDLVRVVGTGPHGAITLADVEGAAAKPSPAVPTPTRPEARAPPPRPAPSLDIRRAIGAAMARSKREIPHYYLATEIDLEAALRWLEEQNRKRSVVDRLLPIALFVRAVALSAREVPDVNGFWSNGTFRPSAVVHVGVGISLRNDAGLIAPALHDVDAKPLSTVMKELADLISRARQGRLRSSELSDATITLTSLGEQGAETVFGVIYPPQVALVGFGAIAPRPRAVDGLLGVRPTVNVTLSGDHRASDGHTGALFLAALGRHLADPETLK